MSKGRIIVKTILTRLSLMAAALFLCAPISHAQLGNPEVYVDMGALQGGSSTTTPLAPVKLKPPAPKPPHEQGFIPRLTSPTPVAPAQPAVLPPAPKIIKPAATVSKLPEMPQGQDVRPAAEKPTPITASVPVIESTPERALPAPSVAPEPSAIIFPVETRVRTETNDPTVSDSSRPVPVRIGVSGNLQDTVTPARPMPNMDPSASPSAPASKSVRVDPEKVAVKKAPPFVPVRKPQHNVSKVADTAAQKVRIDAVRDASSKPKAAPKEVKADAPPLVPSRRPDLVEKASPELVAELRARESIREMDEAAKVGGAVNKKNAIDLSDPPPPPGPRGQKNMPAVKKAAVEAESLGEQVVKLPVENDPLLGSLVEKDKASLVSTIEAMVAAREDGKPLPTAAKPKRDIGSNIVKAEPIQRPYNVHRPQKDNETEIASLPTASAVTKSSGPRPPKPQDQDEQAYVSVPFSEGLTEINKKITSEIEARILPILNENPAWKLQIQAFASPVKDGASSARKASLARALSVRTYLLGKGIDATRMDVRALGAESDRDPMDRVDLIIFDPAKRS